MPEIVVSKKPDAPEAGKKTQQNLKTPAIMVGCFFMSETKPMIDFLNFNPI